MLERLGLWRFGGKRELVILAVLLLLSGCLYVTHDNFRNPQTIASIFTNAAYVAVIASGMTLVILTGQIDISVGSMLGVCAMTSAALAQAGVPIVLTVLFSLALGTTLGVFNGFLSAYLRIPSIIVTLAMLTALEGALLWWSKGLWINELPPEWKVLGTTNFLGLALPVWISWVVVLVVAYLVVKHPFGQKIYAVGDNPSAAERSGINVRLVYFSVLVLNGFLVGLAAMLHATRFSVVAVEGQLLEFMVVTAVLLGGTSIFGGTGTVIGSYLGVLLITTIDMTVSFFGISSEWNIAFRGGLLLIALTLDRISPHEWSLQHIFGGIRRRRMLKPEAPE